MAPKKPPTQLRKGAIELAILTLLDREELYGAELLERLSSYPGLAAPSGTVYPLLTRLTTKELVTSRWEESPKGPPRKYYSLTPQGRAMRDQLASDFQQITEDMLALLHPERRTP
ncbi:PadR family transcriptional regulator [Corynebacterium breve]|uniref:PadR family transcriptional regulator n=1 Tax=Corynebacterium breve TaxID=3049799 RepID=A0ABY8VJL9_9CORY|nr:PadR family transcriptional regulator [Corynebacterium breve]WIM67775.1 PadR family transcriptional regulator [Corynebacterium breve]